MGENKTRYWLNIKAERFLQKELENIVK